MDELVPGATYALGRFALPREEVVEFAQRYDPQSFHLTEEGGKASIFGSMIVPGLQTLATTFGRLVASPLLRDISLGGTAMEIRWTAPLRPGEEVAVTAEVVEVKPSRVRRDRGTARLRYVATRVEDGVVVMDAVGTFILRR
ncbi:MaoC/PaaZ C-terminal domain-containing protein [Roseomonas sp. CCTCC AB2023176]|uniref:MaoC/PaaZ C-terminal domain-containing protein n=1 Tax=Roseomonas sp. CCTCC AB2023176 TaxID=3342640 RepID=UPI0035DFE05D